MPWRCRCSTAEVPDDATCPACGAAKATWTMVGGKTRRFVVTGRKLQVLRGSDATPRAPDDPARASDVAVEATAATSLPKALVRDLLARGLRPASRDVLLVRLSAKGARDADVTLVAAHARREAEEHHLAPLVEPGADGAVDVPIVLVHGVDGEGDPVALDGAHVVDVTDAGEGGPGHAPQVTITALRRPPVRLPVSSPPAGGWAELRLVEPDGRPSARVAVVLVCADGSRREATTDDDGRARWEGLPDGRLEVELVEEGLVPDALEEARPPARAGDARDDQAPRGEDPHDDDDEAEVRRRKAPEGLLA